ncbi:MAG: VWA domain-containing protein [Pirellulaceae bacterium]
MDVQFGNLHNLYLLSAVALVIILGFWAAVARWRAASRFATAIQLRRLMPRGGSTRAWISTILIAVSVLLLVIALVDIRWGKTWQEVPQKGIEVMFLLDVSRSMLAEDAAPNRLNRAKQQIKDMLDVMAGDRVGLIVFAGDTHQSVPLTSHYEDFKQTLDAVGPHSVRRGGSRLGDAITAAANGFISKTNDHKAIVVFTDGGDQESQPVKIAQNLSAEKGIRIFTVGLGDMSQGARIPTSESDDRFVQYKGQQVWSKLNGQILEQIATETGGAYIPAGTRRVNMADVYHRYVANVEQTELETAKINAYTPRYQWFAMPALILLMVEVWITTRTASHGRITRNATKLDTRQHPPREAFRATAIKITTFMRSTKKSVIHGLLAAWLAGWVSTSPAAAQDASIENAKRINAANALVREGKVNEALAEYRQLPPTGANREQLIYNMAVAEYQSGDLDAARSHFAEVAASTNFALAADSRYNLGNCLYRDALNQVEQEPTGAIELLQTAITHYRGSLAGNPQNVDARANIELAAELIKSLRQKQSQQQNQQANQQEKQQSDQSQSDQSQSDQSQSDQSQSDQSQSDQSQSDQSQSDQSQSSAERDSESQAKQQDQEQAREQAQEQSDASGQDSKQSEQVDESQSEANPKPNRSKDQPHSDEPTEQTGPSDTEEQSGDQTQQDQTPADDSGENASQKQDSVQSQSSPDQSGQSSDEPLAEPAENEPVGEQDESQDVPKGELKAAGVGESNTDVERHTTPTGAEEPLQHDGRMTLEEALKMLQAVRDRDMLRRLRQQRTERERHIPTDRDW